MISSTTQQDALTLAARAPGGSVRHCQLQPGQGVFVGASANCGLRIPAKSVADIHCRIEFYDGVISVQDWMSPSGTRVNGKTITGRTDVSPGQWIEVGDHRITLEERTLESSDKPLPSTDVDCAEPPGSIDDFHESPASIDDLHESSRETATLEPVSDDSIWDSATTMAWGFETQDEDFCFDADEVCDGETVALLKAEIEVLRAALSFSDSASQVADGHEAVVEDAEPASDATLRRMQELVDEANRSDERASMLEEILHAAEDTNRSEREERYQLEAWVADIEQRIGQRENEHAAELTALSARLEESERQRDELHRTIRDSPGGGNAPPGYEETVANLQQTIRSLTDELSESRKSCKSLESKLEQLSGDQDRGLREERAQIAKERARLSRLRFELSSKLTGLESLPRTENHADKEMAHKLQTLRQHLREIHEQEKREEREAPLATRLAKLWRRVEY